MITRLLRDTRAITCLVLSKNESITIDLFSGFTERVAAIKVYQEAGQQSWIPWFAIMNNAGQIMARVNAAAVQMVLYDDPG